MIVSPLADSFDMDLRFYEGVLIPNLKTKFWSMNMGTALRLLRLVGLELGAIEKLIQNNSEVYNDLRLNE